MATIILDLLLAVLAVGWYLSHQAGRVDRLHHRVDSTAAALRANLHLRAQTLNMAAQRVGGQAGQDAAASAAASLTQPWADNATLASVENAVTAAIWRLLAQPGGRQALGAEGIDQLRHACRRVQLARRFHAEAVQACRLVRQQKLVRWLRLAGHATMPRTIDFADDVPTR
jgi:hypothetical protein